MLSFSPSRRRAVAALLAVALAASACGTGEETTTPDLGVIPSTAPEENSAGETAAETAAEDAADAEDSGAVDEEPSAAAENLFPDIDVVNIADGSIVNLANELGGADRPTLLWFWAPH